MPNIGYNPTQTLHTFFSIFDHNTFEDLIEFAPAIYNEFFNDITCSLNEIGCSTALNVVDNQLLLITD